MRRRGFTLVELVVTVAIIGVLVSAAWPLAELGVRRAKEAELRAALREIRGAIDRYKQAADEGRIRRGVDQSGYPPNLEVLVSGVEDAKSAQKRTIYLLRRLPRDPFADRNVAAVDGWGLRSYDSPPDVPRAGRDVFDVYSRAEGVGLNGVPYREW